MLQSVEDIKDQLPDEISVFVAGKTQKELGNFFTSFDDVIMSTDGTPVSRSARAGVTPQSPLCFLYTSGTTGDFVVYSNLVQSGVVEVDLLFNVTFNDILVICDGI